MFHLKYPSPLDLEASADYSAYIYDTKAAGGGSLTKWLTPPHDAGTGPYTVQTWNKGQEFEVTSRPSPATGAAGSGAHYKNVVFRVVPQDTTAAQLLRVGPGHLRRADEPAAVGVAAGRSRASSR